MLKILNIEDCLELATGLTQGPKISLESSDINIMSSIGRQVFKGVALTDRQHVLMKEKLKKYENQFNDVANFDIVLDTLRQPLRHVDRSKFITVVSNSSIPTTDFDERTLWIKVRFPFSKTLISKIDICKPTGVYSNFYYHKKGTHEHFFVFNEQNVFNLLSEFSNNNFVIDEKVTLFYNKLIEIKDSSTEFIPAIENTKLIGLVPNALEAAETEIGKLDHNNLYKYIDRKRRFGIVNINININPKTTIEKIITRKDQDMLARPSEIPASDLISAIHALDRYPLLVCVEKETSESQTYEVFNNLKGLVDSSEQSVLFRLPNETGESFNEWVKEKSLNNWVDKNTKVVYINNDKLPKLLVGDEWKPIAALCFNSFLQPLTKTYIESFCDLILYREESKSAFRSFWSRKYGL